MYRHYYQNTDAFVYVVDSNDRERIDDCREELSKMLEEKELENAPVLVLANKQDLPNAMTVQEITDKLQLNQIRDRQWCKYINIITFTQMNVPFHCTKKEENTN